RACDHALILFSDVINTPVIECAVSPHKEGISMLNAQRSTTLNVYAYMSSHSVPYSFFTARQNWILVVILLLAAVILAAGDLNGAYWVDEVITVERAGAPNHGGPFSPLEIWLHTADTTNAHVPGRYIAVADRDTALGRGEFAARLLSHVG